MSVAQEIASMFVMGRNLRMQEQQAAREQQLHERDLDLRGAQIEQAQASAMGTVQDQARKQIDAVRQAELNKMKALTNILPRIKQNPAMWPQARDVMGKMGFNTADLPEQVEPQHLDSLLQGAQGTVAMLSDGPKVEATTMRAAQELWGAGPESIPEIFADPAKRGQLFAKIGEIDTDGKRQETASKLRNEFQALPQVKSAQLVATMYDKVQSATPTPAGDMALIFGYMKILDPGSNVKEGEYANAKNAGSIPIKIRNAYNNALTGELLEEGQRNDFRQNAARAFSAEMKRYDVAAREYSDLATRSGASPDDVVLKAGFSRGARSGQVDYKAIAEKVKADVEAGRIPPEKAREAYDAVIQQVGAGQ
jgi:hypothetical protein